MLRRAFFLGLPMLPLLGRAAGAQPAGDQARRVVLSISGRITSGGRQDFTLEELEALGTAEIQTQTPWTVGMQRFSGVPLQTLLAKVGSLGETLRMSALNDYAITMPASDAREHGVLLATRLGGQPMRVRDKGPLWVIYPFTTKPQLDNTAYYERSIWQLRKIEVA